MTQDLSHTLWKNLYETWWEQGYGAHVLFDMAATELEISRDDLIHAFEILKEQNLVDYASMGSMAITPLGILTAEEQGIASPEHTRHNENARLKMLDELAKVREEHGFHSSCPWQLMIEKEGLGEIDFLRNYEILTQAGWMQSQSIGHYCITSDGYKLVQEWRKRQEMASEFGTLLNNSQLTPQQRGHRLEEMLEKIITKEGWECSRNVRAPGEENDLIIHRVREYYLMECKWEQGNTGGRQVRDLLSKVSGRPGVSGIFVSMAGYSSEAIESLRLTMNNDLLLLYGPRDVERMMKNEISFTDLLNAKFHVAMSHKRLDVE